MAHSKIATQITKGGKPKEPTPLELDIGQALIDLEANSDLKIELKDLRIASAREIQVDAKTSAIIVFMPYRLVKRFQKINQRLIRELEKKFTAKHVLFVAQRSIHSKAFPRQNKGQLRARSRTLTAVHEAILNDIIFPTQVVARRTRVKKDGSKLMKIYLDPKDRNNVDYRVATYQKVYASLTNKQVDFMFPPSSDHHRV